MNRLIAILFLTCSLSHAATTTVEGPGTNMAANTVFAGPTSGAAKPGTSRALVASDFPTSIIPTVKQSVVATTASNQSVSAFSGTTLDGVSLTSGTSRILLTGQSTTHENGLWVYNGSGSALTRPTDYTAGSTTQSFFGIMVYIKQGGTAHGATWSVQTTTGVITIGTTGTTWSYEVASVPAGGTGLTNGTSGGILGFTGTTTLASSVLLTNHAIVIGGGAGATPTPLASLGTSTTVLHGAAAGDPTFSAVALGADVSGQLGITNGGTGANNTATAGNLLIGNGTTFQSVAMGTDATISSAGALTIANSAITNVKIDAAAAIAVSKLGTGGTIPANSGVNLTALNGSNVASGLVGIAVGGTGANNAATSGNILVANGTTFPSVAMSGDVTIVSGGATTIANLAVTNAKIAASTIDLTAKVTGVLPVANGGNNASSVTTGNVMLATSSTTIASTPLQFGRNLLINGDFNVWQRGTSGPTATNNAYSADRWRLVLGAATAATVARGTGPTTSPYACVLTVGAANNNKFGVFQPIEGVNVYQARGKVLTLSAQIKTSASLSNIKMGIMQWTSTEDGVSADPVSAWNADGTTPTLTTWTFSNTPANLSATTSFVTYSVQSGTISTSTTNLGVMIWNDDKTTTAADTLSIGEVQLEISPVATAFEVLPITTAILRCQRYFCKSFPIGTTPASNVGQTGAATYFAQVASTTAGYGCTAKFPVTMRGTPSTITFYSPSTTGSNWYGNGAASGAATAYSQSADAMVIFNPQVAGGSPTTVGSTQVIHWTAESEL